MDCDLVGRRANPSQQTDRHTPCIGGRGRISVFRCAIHRLDSFLNYNLIKNKHCGRCIQTSPLRRLLHHAGWVAGTARNRRAVSDLPLSLSSRYVPALSLNLTMARFTIPRHQFRRVLSRNGLYSDDASQLPGSTIPPRASDAASRSCTPTQRLKRYTVLAI